ncbi:MAG: hypothetical protein OXM03_06075 [Chloroflexota bacterium]|nr:hypothetical protein [Chloroflexota bacterium]MDE2931367.1 hypothetical protein [Chloroflexota bacterium]
MSRSEDDQNKKERQEADRTREELDVILSARQELGTEYNDELADKLMERLDAVIDRRVEARLQKDSKSTSLSPAVPICSLVFAIPLTAIAASMLGFRGVAVVWAALIIVNILYSGKKLGDIF